MRTAGRLVVVIAVAATGATAAAPAKLPFAGLFHAKVAWTLPCQYGHDGQLAAHGELACAIDAASTAGATTRAHLTCSGQTDVLGDIHAWALEPRTLVATADGLWSVDDDGPDGRGSADVAHATSAPPLLAAKPAAGKRRRDDDPNGYAGMWFVTSQLGTSWCVGKTPWGWGGGTHVWITCFSPDGQLTGMAGFKQESNIAELRCGATPPAQSVLDEIRR
jgi:hypothetical protein|nr:hypothetical protein [Kofleriaceae bacterium]